MKRDNTSRLKRIKNIAHMAEMRAEAKGHVTYLDVELLMSELNLLLNSLRREGYAVRHLITEFYPREDQL